MFFRPLSIQSIQLYCPCVKSPIHERGDGGVKPQVSEGVNYGSYLFHGEGKYYLFTTHRKPGKSGENIVLYPKICRRPVKDIT